MAINYFLETDANSRNFVYKNLLLWFKEKQYQVEGTEADGLYLIQAQKVGKLRTVLGTNLAFKVKISKSNDFTNPREFIVETSTGKWIQNIAGAGVTAMFLGGFTVFTGLAGAGWALVIEHEIITYIEETLKFKKVQKLAPLSEDKPLESSNYFSNQEKAQTSGSANYSAREKAVAKADQDLKKLESAFANHILTEAEFLAKKQRLEHQIDEDEIEFLVEEKLAKFQQAFTDGILTADEFEAKIHQVEEDVKNQLIHQRLEQEKEQVLMKLKAALDSGILTPDEYAKKVEFL
ncbi:MAG: SHOCT domain-containing protein [Lyngbya sp.]|nr:SHOCT domain-containing protein [Lyngbya sp.]